MMHFSLAVQCRRREVSRSILCRSRDSSRAGPGDLCAMKACVHASAHHAFIMLTFWALVAYLAINLWLRGCGCQCKGTPESKPWPFSIYSHLQLIQKYATCKYAGIHRYSHAKSIQKENNTPNCIKCYNSGPILLNDVFNDLDRSNIYLRS